MERRRAEKGGKGERKRKDREGNEKEEGEGSIDQKVEKGKN